MKKLDVVLYLYDHVNQTDQALNKIDVIMVRYKPTDIFNSFEIESLISWCNQ